MDSRFFLKLLVHGTGLLSLKLRHWLYLDHMFLTIGVHPFRIILWKGHAEYRIRISVIYLSPFIGRFILLDVENLLLRLISEEHRQSMVDSTRKL